MKISDPLNPPFIRPFQIWSPFQIRVPPFTSART